MVRAKNTQDNTVEILGNVPAEAQELADLDDAEDGDLFKGIDEIRSISGATFQVSRILPVDKAGYCDDIPPAEFSLSTLTKRFGAGKYRVRIKGPSGYLKGGGNVTIAPQAEKVSTNGGTDLSQLLELMDRRDAQAKEKNSQVMNTVLTLGIPALTTILAAMVGRSSGPDIATLITALKPAPGPTLNDLAGTLASMKALTQDKTPTADPLDQFAKALDLVKDLKSEGGSGGETNWMDIIKSVIENAGPTLAPFLEKLQAAQAARTVATQPQPNPTVQQVQPAVAAPQPDNDPMMTLARENLQKIEKWARTDRDPMIYAQVFLDDIPDHIEALLPPDQVLKYLKDTPNWFEVICGVNPGLTEFKDYCDELRKEVINILEFSDKETIGE